MTTTKTLEQAAVEVNKVICAAYEEHDELFLAPFTWRNDLGEYELTGEEKETYYNLEDCDSLRQDDNGVWFLDGDRYAEDRSEYYTDKAYEFIRENYPEFNEVELLDAALGLGW